jgi:predicted acylesterase/phospholipase RssA
MWSRPNGLQGALVTQLRIALMLPGEASLGAFEAGAMSALVIGVQAVNATASRDRVVVDVLSGASSGALTAVLAARMLLSGQDPVAPLRRAWVQEPSIKALCGQGRGAPLSLDRARDVAYDILTSNPPASGLPQQADVTVAFALSCLRGFTYELLGRNATDPIQATSYVDWANVTFNAADHARGFTDAWDKAVDAAIASASHPLAFPPVLLNREDEREEYLRRGIRNLPDGDELELWYADGGMLDRQPLGRCLDLVAAKDKDTDPDDVKRMVVLVRTDCDSAPKPSDPAWSAATDPDYGATLTRTLRLVTTHSLFEDLRRAEKTNNQLAWARSLATRLAGAIADGDQAAVKAALRAQVAEINRERAELMPGRPTTEPSEAPDELRVLLEHTLMLAAGLQSKLQVDISEVVGRNSEVAGASLARFGGFFAERTRAHDFLLGYRNMLIWMHNNLERGAVDRTPAMHAARTRATTIPGWIGGRGTPRRNLRSGAQAFTLGARVLRSSVSQRVGPR